MISALNQIATEANRNSEIEELENAPEINSVVVVDVQNFTGYDNSTIDLTENDGELDLAWEVAINTPSLPTVNNSNAPQPKLMSQDMKNNIGQRGEIIVFNHLKKEWAKKADLVTESDKKLVFKDSEGKIIKIKLLNSEGRKGKGSDIVITNEETTIAYIEVKSTKMSDKELFPVNWYQWAFAYKIFSQGEGNKYFFYIVKGALSDKPGITIIKNPIKKWKDGELKAQPVNLEL